MEESKVHEMRYLKGTAADSFAPGQRERTQTVGCTPASCSTDGLKKPESNTSKLKRQTFG